MKASLMSVMCYAIHSLNNLPARVISWLCPMYSTSGKERQEKGTEFLPFSLLVVCKYTIKEQKNHEAPPISVAHLLSPAMQHVNYTTISN